MSAIATVPANTLLIVLTRTAGPVGLPRRVGRCTVQPDGSSRFRGWTTSKYGAGYEVELLSWVTLSVALAPVSLVASRSGAEGTAGRTYRS